MMNSKTLKATALGAAVTAALYSGVASAELTGNAAVTNNYIWRGITQSNDSAAGQGGLDWGHSSGVYVGTWLSNVDFSGDFGSGYENGTGYEMDVYAGYGGEAGGFGYDLGVISYQYPVTPNYNFTELYVSGTFSVVTISLNYTVDAASGLDAENTVDAPGVFDKGDLYLFGSLDFETKAGDISLYAGSYMFDNSDKTFANGNAYGDLDYVHYGASLGKGDFTFAVDKNDLDDTTLNKVRFTVMWSKDFELL